MEASCHGRRVRGRLHGAVKESHRCGHSYLPVRGSRQRRGQARHPDLVQRYRRQLAHYRHGRLESRAKINGANERGSKLNEERGPSPLRPQVDRELVALEDDRVTVAAAPLNGKGIAIEVPSRDRNVIGPGGRLVIGDDGHRLADIAPGGPVEGIHAGVQKR